MHEISETGDLRTWGAAALTRVGCLPCDAWTRQGRVGGRCNANGVPHAYNQILNHSPRIRGSPVQPRLRLRPTTPAVCLHGVYVVSGMLMVAGRQIRPRS